MSIAQGLTDRDLAECAATLIALQDGEELPSNGLFVDMVIPFVRGEMPNQSTGLINSVAKNTILYEIAHRWAKEKLV